MISSATGGFNNSRLLGERNTGSFYKGNLTPTEIIAVKKIACTTRQQKTTLIAEIASISRLRQRNLVNLLGYCSKGNEIYLVYEYVPNGSLDRFLFSNDRPVLTWSDRFCIIKGLAAGLQYLHGEGQRRKRESQQRTLRRRATRSTRRLRTRNQAQQRLGIRGARASRDSKGYPRHRCVWFWGVDNGDCLWKEGHRADKTTWRDQFSELGASRVQERRSFTEMRHENE